MTDDLPPLEHKRILKVLIFTHGDPATAGQVQKADAIEHEGKIWFVPQWLDSNTEAWRIPVRLVCLSELPAIAHLQKTPGFDGADYLLNYPVPIAEFSQMTPPAESHGFLVVEKPYFRVALTH